MRALAQDLWYQAFPLTLMGADFRRNVSVIRLAGGALVIHSTAPFSQPQIAGIRDLGEPRWVLDAMLDHDTFSRGGRDAFPEAEFLGPEGLAERVGFPVRPLLPPPPEWAGELEVRAIEGAPAFGEHVFLHRASRTLLVADLLAHFPGVGLSWTGALARLALRGGVAPGFSRRLAMAVKDRAAFATSLRGLLEWDFDRVIVGHGEPIESGGREAAEALFRRTGWL